MDHTSLHLQGYVTSEKIAADDVVDGVSGRTKVLEISTKPRKDMAPLILVNGEHGERLRFEPGFPVAVYGPEVVYLEKHGENPWSREQDALRS